MDWRWTALILGGIVTAAVAPRDWMTNKDESGPYGLWPQNVLYAQADGRDDRWNDDGRDDAQRGADRGPGAEYRWDNDDAYFAQRGPGRGPGFDRGSDRGPGPDHRQEMGHRDDRGPGGPPPNGPRGPRPEMSGRGDRGPGGPPPAGPRGPQGDFGPPRGDRFEHAPHDRGPRSDPRHDGDRFADRRGDDHRGDHRGPPPPPHFGHDRDQGPRHPGFGPDHGPHGDFGPPRDGHFEHARHDRGPRHHDDRFADRREEDHRGDRRGPPPQPHFDHHRNHGPQHAGRGPRSDEHRGGPGHDFRGMGPGRPSFGPPAFAQHGMMRFRGGTGHNGTRGPMGPPPFVRERMAHRFGGQSSGPPRFAGAQMQHFRGGMGHGGQRGSFGPPPFARGHMMGPMGVGPGGHPGMGPHAFGPPSGGHNPMAMLDANHDGKISKEEVLKHFAEVDTNHDDAVTMDELQSHMRQHHPMPGHGPQAGPQHGDHHPGQPGRPEAAPGNPGPRPGQPGPGGPDAHGPGRGGPGFGPGAPGFGGPGRGGPPSPNAMLEHFDKNKDGKLSKDEVPAPMWEHLSKADTDGDGSVSAAELEAHAKTMRPGRPGPDAPKAPETKPEAAPEKPAEPPKQAEADISPADAVSVLPST